MNQLTERTILMAVIAVVTLFAPCARATAFNFNGYTAGMSKVAAKAVGVTGCRNGQGLTESSDAIYCEIPSQFRKLGDLTASKAILEFKAPQHLLVSQIRLSFAEPTEAVKAAMSAAFGQSTEDETYIYWKRGSETGKLYKSRRGTSYVTFEYDARVGKARNQTARAEELKKNSLKAF
jgi:hypothetical protein